MLGSWVPLTYELLYWASGLLEWLVLGYAYSHSQSFRIRRYQLVAEGGRTFRVEAVGSGGGWGVNGSIVVFVYIYEFCLAVATG